MIKSINYVAVITPFPKKFRQYKRSIRTFGEEYIHVRSLQDLRGYIFKRRVLLYGWPKIEDIDLIMEKFIL